VGYEAGDPGAGGFVKVVCEKCGKSNFVQLVSFNGVTYREEDFKRDFIDTGRAKRAIEMAGRVGK